ncbi:hypothetical protein [Kingella pumchi]|jgi:hypothetical protein|uniref:Uncharacterized protein n=1 Tax=Kingella pumchi TaxID=2779506 RepID=A0ABS9NLM8_9NEIS|nr:hypothetical protein [Kingella pumchi]MCG6503425.1 hypothetical protein [Kingella pumchi]
MALSLSVPWEKSSLKAVKTAEPLASCRGMLTVQEAGALRAWITAPYAADPARRCAAVQGNMHQLMRRYGITPTAR